MAGDDNPVVLSWVQDLSYALSLPPGLNQEKKAHRALNRHHGWAPESGEEPPEALVEAHYQLRRASNHRVRVSLHADGTHTLEILLR